MRYETVNPVTAIVVIIPIVKLNIPTTIQNGSNNVWLFIDDHARATVPKPILPTYIRDESMGRINENLAKSNTCPPKSCG